MDLNQIRLNPSILLCGGTLTPDISYQVDAWHQISVIRLMRSAKHCRLWELDYSHVRLATCKTKAKQAQGVVNSTSIRNTEPTVLINKHILIFVEEGTYKYSQTGPVWQNVNVHRIQHWWHLVNKYKQEGIKEVLISNCLRGTQVLADLIEFSAFQDFCAFP